MQGQRVMVDFHLFAMAYVDSEAAVDAEFFALGAMGTWNVVPMAPLQRRRSGRGDAGRPIARRTRGGRGLTDEARGDTETTTLLDFRTTPGDTQKSRR